jgi:hypothetical protein
VTPEHLAKGDYPTGSDAVRVALGWTLAETVEHRRVLAIPCPWCDAPVGEPCVSKATGEPLGGRFSHPSRSGA